MTDETTPRCDDENGTLGDGVGNPTQCVKPFGHNGAHAWHHTDPRGEHTTVVWWLESSRRPR